MADNLQTLFSAKHHWLVTGAAGFIGSNICEYLLKHDQKVTAVDNFITGYRENIQDLTEISKKHGDFQFVEGDIRENALMLNITKGVDFVLHQAAVGSVPRSIKTPDVAHSHNVDGFFSVLNAVRLNGVKSLVYASSSSVYGDEKSLPKVESRIGQPLSPYAVTKLINELYAQTYSKVYGTKVIGLRYFNVFGPRQNPEGEYAAVIPRWIKAITENKQVTIFGDGETTRDFCYVLNAVQANVRAAFKATELSQHEIFNVAYFEQTSLNELYRLLVENIRNYLPDVEWVAPDYQDFRSGDIRHSLADISKAKEVIGYAPTHSIRDGIADCMKWYLKSLSVPLSKERTSVVEPSL